MDRRFELQNILESIMSGNKVYFQPPETIRISYPCIIYEEQPKIHIYADNTTYKNSKCYQITLIDRDPDCVYREKLEMLSYVKCNRIFSMNNLHHFVYTIYY